MVRTANPNSATKTRLLDAAERLMLARGFAATSVDDICAAAKLTKGSLFHYFESKEDLARTLLERFCVSGTAARESACCQERDPLARVYSHIDFAVKMARDSARRQGCLLGVFAQELSDSHPKMRSMCAEGFAQWSAVLTRDLEAAKMRYKPKTAFAAQSLADHFIVILEGAQILAKTQQNPKVVEKSLRHFRQYVESLFGRRAG